MGGTGGFHPNFLFLPPSGKLWGGATPPIISLPTLSFSTLFKNNHKINIMKIIYISLKYSNLSLKH
jgi:hypothetical protein